MPTAKMGVAAFDRVGVGEAEATAEFEITETVLSPLLLTYNSPVPESYAIPTGSAPTDTVATTV
jgi:hypothetical protein